ncbi:MAG: helix-turn-helix transcriptional regulator [Cyanobacteria bacterium P01_C01_bin.89]
MTPPLPHSWSNLLLPSTASDAQLLHADTSDVIRVCPKKLGQGYHQYIPLRDDLTLGILDYVFNHEVTVDSAGPGDILEFTFHLESRVSNRTFFIPDFGWSSLAVIPARQRLFKVELFFKRPELTSHYYDFLDRLDPNTFDVVANMVQSAHRLFHHRRSGSSKEAIARMIDRLHDVRDVQPLYVMDYQSTGALRRDGIEIDYALGTPLTEEMAPIIDNILSCPYHGKTRRSYLERQAAKLIELRLVAMEQQQRVSVDADYVRQASAILRQNFVNPPGVEELARLVGTNRFKLNQGFRHIYNTTPFGYVRDCRLRNARSLLLMSELSVAQVAEAVGYTCRSKFATAFRQKYCINPKAFQMQAWGWAS